MEEQEEQKSNRYDWRDPTALTRDALSREIASLRELLEALLRGLDDKFTTRLTAMDTALHLIQSQADKVPSEVDMKVGYLQALHGERLNSIERMMSTQFTELDKRIAQTTESSSTAINAALQAAKEAVNQQNVAFAQATSKSEIAVAKQMDQLGQMITNGMTSMNEKVDSSTARADIAVSSLRNELLPQITGERSRGDIGAGRQLGQAALVAIIFGAVAATGTIIGVIVVMTRAGSG